MVRASCPEHAARSPITHTTSGCTCWRYIGRGSARRKHSSGGTAEAGDALGSRLVAARLVRDVMRLAFILERTYAHYTKWFGTAFNRLRCASELGLHT
jgi:hypothetical protein